MFLIVKKGINVIALESTEAVIANVFASIREEYKELEIDIQFNNPNCEVFINIIAFVRAIDKDLHKGIDKEESLHIGEDIKSVVDVELEDNKEDDEIAIEIEEVPSESPAISSQDLVLNLEETKQYKEDEQSTIEIEEVQQEEEKIEVEEDEVEEEKVIEPVNEVEQKEEVQVEQVEVRRKVTPADRMMEALKEEQKKAGLPKLEGDKLNTLEYKNYLVNYMKLGFACSILKKKTKDCKEKAEKDKFAMFCKMIDDRTEEYELVFKEIGLTTGQIHTFRMEVLREVKKYSDESIRRIFEYLSNLYKDSEEFIQKLKR